MPRRRQGPGAPARTGGMDRYLDLSRSGLSRHGARAALRRGEAPLRRPYGRHQPGASGDAGRDRHPGPLRRGPDRTRALRDIEAETDIASLTYTGEHEDYFFLVEAELRRRLGDLGGALHTARSRNDMDHTVFKMALRVRAEDLMDRVQRLASPRDRQGGDREGDADRRLYPRPAGPADDLRPLPRRRHRGAPARRGAT